MKEIGFSLLELMVALAVAAIIATFAVPAYRTHVAKAHRVDAASALTRAVQFVETARLAQTSEGVDAITLSAGLDQAPSNGATVYRRRRAPGIADERRLRDRSRAHRGGPDV